MITYTVTKNSSFFADKYLLKSSRRSIIKAEDCGGCKGRDEIQGTLQLFTTVSQDNLGNGFSSELYSYRDGGKAFCPTSECVDGTITNVVGGYYRCKSLTYDGVTIWSSNGRATIKSTYAACGLGNPGQVNGKCRTYKYVKQVFSIPQTTTVNTPTTSRVAMKSTIPTTIFKTAVASNIFVIKNNKIVLAEKEQTVITQTTTVVNSQKIVLTDNKTETTSAWKATYTLSVDEFDQIVGCPYTKKTFRKEFSTFDYFGFISALYDTVGHLTDYHQYWYRTLNDTIEGTADKLKVFKFGQRGSPMNKTDFTIKYIEKLASSSKAIYPYDCSSNSFTYETSLIKKELNIQKSSYFSTQALSLYAFGKVSKVEVSYLSSKQDTIITKNYSSLVENKNLPISSTTIVITKLQNINLGGLNFQAPFKSTEKVESHIPNKLTFFTHGDCPNATDYAEITQYSNVGYKSINSHIVKYQTIFNRFNLGAVISPASINNFYSNVVLKNGNQVPIGEISFLRYLTIPIAELNSFVDIGNRTYNASQPDGVDISYTTVTKDTSKGAQTSQITSVIRDFWTAAGEIKNETFLYDTYENIDIGGTNNILNNYISNNEFNLGGVGEDGQAQITRVYENGYYLKIENQFKTFSTSNLLIISDSSNRIPLIPTYVVSTVDNDELIYFKGANLLLPEAINILNNSSANDSVGNSIWPLIYN